MFTIETVPSLLSTWGVPITQFCEIIFNTRQRSCGKIMFSQVFVCPRKGVQGISGPMSFPGVGGYVQRVDTVSQRAVNILLECFLVCNANRYRHTQVEGQFPQIQLVLAFLGSWTWARIVLMLCKWHCYFIICTIRLSTSLLMSFLSSLNDMTSYP